MTYLFPIDANFIEKASKGDYWTDSGCDIGVPLGTPVVAVGDGTVIYAEAGHTRWNTPPDTAYSAKIKLDVPIERNGKKYPFVFYTHLANVAYWNKGARIKAGEQLGISGIGNRVAHLHITFYESLVGGGYIGDGADRFDDQTMLWDEWLPAQRKPILVEKKRRKPMPQEGKTVYWLGVKPRSTIYVLNKNDNPVSVDIEFHLGQRTQGANDWVKSKLLSSNAQLGVQPFSELASDYNSDFYGWVRVTSDTPVWSDLE